MATLDDTKVAHTTRVDDWWKRVIHSITTRLNGHKNDDDEEDDIEKNEGQLWNKHDGPVCGMVLFVVDDVQSGRWTNCTPHCSVVTWVWITQRHASFTTSGSLV